jgi:hypothetical protein
MRPVRALLLVAAAASLVACGGGGDDPAMSGEPTPTSETTTSSSSSSTSSTTAPASSGEEVSAEVIGIDAAARTITVDLIELLTGAEAQAEWEAQGGDPGEGPPNDYIIRDDEDVEVTYDIAEDATFSIVDMSGAVTEGVEATLEELVDAHEATPFTVRLVLDGETVTEIHQRYTP